MANNQQYRFSRGEYGYITFDSKGYIVEAKGFGSLMWNSDLNIDKKLIGKHIDELSEMLEKNCSSRDVYLEFEANVHVGLLKKMLQNVKN